ncbi:uncharacterized protein CLUP02_14423 [Colletotrichum lupini]|uniref:Uncharacterized protein n=1 Tax=Colletotrichum lupini TaxID=145971 RepID=A0A9Q8WMQ1_9PEZI|nr:uncharacterized protein CLUP02_14423 [Colletotrichum lupini]UQC88896.1 hypothetical protein CLUP02_14423 [Colletotrichum lupini]
MGKAAVDGVGVELPAAFPFSKVPLQFVPSLVSEYYYLCLPDTDYVHHLEGLFPYFPAFDFCLDVAYFSVVCFFGLAVLPSYAPNEASYHPALALATRRKPRNLLGDGSFNFLPRVGGAVIFTFAEVTFTPPSPKSARLDGVLDYIILGSGHIMRNHIPTAEVLQPPGNKAECVTVSTEYCFLIWELKDAVHFGRHLPSCYVMPDDQWCNPVDNLQLTDPPLLGHHIIHAAHRTITKEESYELLARHRRQPMPLPSHGPTHIADLLRSRADCRLPIPGLKKDIHPGASWRWVTCIYPLVCHVTSVEYLSLALSGLQICRGSPQGLGFPADHICNYGYKMSVGIHTVPGACMPPGLSLPGKERRIFKTTQKPFHFQTHHGRDKCHNDEGGFLFPTANARRQCFVGILSSLNVPLLSRRIISVLTRLNLWFALDKTTAETRKLDS